MCRHCAVSGDGHGALTRRSFQQGLFAAVAQPAMAACLPNLPDPVVEPLMSLQVPAGAPRTVALTLDACSGLVDMRIIDTLTELSIRATIFATGLWLRSSAAILPLLRSRPDLFSVQNHGARHLPPVLGSHRLYGIAPAGTLDAIRQEVDGGAAAIIQAGFPAPHWYRGATGLYSPPAIGLIQQMDDRVAGYSLVADQGASLPAASVAKRIEAAVTGDVIIAHVNQPHRSSGAGVAAGLAALHAAGVAFAALDAFPATPLACRAQSAAPSRT